MILTFEDIKYARLDNGIVTISDALAPNNSPDKPIVLTTFDTKDAATVDASDDTPAMEAKYFAP